MLDPQAKAFLELMEGRESTAELSPEENRKRGVETQKLAGPKMLVAKVEEYMIPVEDAEITGRVYTPEGQGLFPIFIYLHGGGWVLGDLETVDSLCRSIANKAKCIVVSVDYRLAPEHRFPTAFEDCYTASRWIAVHAKEWNGDPERIAIGGDSAGGNLAAAVTLKAKHEKEPIFNAQVLVYPVTDLTFTTSSYEENEEGYFLTHESMMWFRNHYLPNKEDWSNVYAAPLLAEDFSELPPTLVITAEYDPLRDEGLAYADKLEKAGVQVESTCYEGMIHGFFWMDGMMDKGKEAIEQVASYLNKVFNKKRVY